MTVQDGWFLVSVASGVVNLGLLVYNWRTARQLRRLRYVLLEIAVQAYAIQRVAPLWQMFPGKRFAANIEVHDG